MSRRVTGGQNRGFAHALGIVVGHKHVRFVGWKETVVVDILQVCNAAIRTEG